MNEYVASGKPCRLSDLSFCTCKVGIRMPSAKGSIRGPLPWGVWFLSHLPHLPSHDPSRAQGPRCHMGSPQDALTLEAALKGHTHVLTCAKGPGQQGAGGHVRPDFLFLSGDVPDSLSQTVSVTDGQG